MVRLAAQPRVLPKGNVVIAPSPKQSLSTPVDVDQQQQQQAASSSKITLDPPCFALYSEFEKSCVTTSLSTASPVSMIPRPNRSLASMQVEFDQAKKEVQDIFQNIVGTFARDENRGKKKFFDTTFFVGSLRTLYPAGSPQDSCTVGQPTSIVRATEIFKNELFSAQDELLIQGQLGDGHLLAAMKILGADHFKKLIVASDIEKGIYAVLFWAIGTWEYVIVDDLLPVDEKGEPLFLTTRSKSQLHQVIIEKAFAKLHGSFDAIDGGYTAASLSTLSGGVRMTLDLKNMHWKEFNSLVNHSNDGGKTKNATLCASLTSKAPSAATCGIPKDRSFLVKDVIETKERVGFVVLQHLLPFSSSSTTKTDENKTFSFGAIEPSSWKSPQHNFTNVPTVADKTCFVVPAVDFRHFFSCDAVIVNDLATTPYYDIEGVADTGPIGQGDDVFIVFLNKPIREKITKLQFVIGQLETRFISPLLGESRESHDILKGAGDWPLKTFQLGARVFYHPDGVPQRDNFPLSKKVELGSRVITHAETVLVEIDFSAIPEHRLPTNNGGVSPSSSCYLSVIPICDSRTPYYISVMNVSRGAHHDDLSIFRLFDGPDVVARVLGKKEGLSSKSIKFEPVKDSFIIAEGENDDDNDDDDNEDENEEFWCPEGQKKKGPTKEQLRAMFDQFDIDGSGSLESYELTALFLHHFQSLSPKAVQTKIKAADVNADGKISFKEFKVLAKDLFNNQ